MTSDDLEQILTDWQRARNAAPDADIYTIDASFAGQAGLPVLAGLLHLAARLEQARGHVSPVEMLAELCPLLSLARGEAAVRLRCRGASDGVPGLVSIPAKVLERMPPQADAFAE